MSKITFVFSTCKPQVGNLNLITNDYSDYQCFHYQCLSFLNSSHLQSVLIVTIFFRHQQGDHQNYTMWMLTSNGN